MCSGSVKEVCSEEGKMTCKNVLSKKFQKYFLRQASIFETNIFSLKLFLSLHCALLALKNESEGE